MELKELLGAAFKEGMTVDDIAKAIEDKKFADLTSGEYVSVGKLTEAQQKAKVAEDKLKEIERSQMSEEEKRAAADKESQDRIAALTAQLNRTEVEKIFAKSGMSEDDYSPFVADCVFDDLEKSKKFAESITTAFKKKIDATREETEKTTRAKLIKDNTITPGADDDGSKGSAYGERLAKANAAGAGDEIKSQYK